MLGGFMLAIGIGPVGRGKGVKNTNIEEGRCDVGPLFKSL